MTLLRKGSFIRKVKDISISSALTVTFLSAGILFQSCTPGQDTEADYSYEEVTYSRGIRSQIKEVSPGEFQITSEESVPVESAMAIVTYLDGHTDTLTVSASKALIDDEIQNNGSQVGHHSGLSSMLLYGGIGYMLGRSMNNGYINQHRDGAANKSRFYGSSTAYNQSQAATQDVNSSRTSRMVRTRPAGGKSGFFGSSRSGGPAAS